MVDRVHYTAQFLSGCKTLAKKHKTKELDKLCEIIIKLERQEITTQYGNHPVGKVNDIHIAGDIILLYKYDTDNKLLTVSLELNNLVNHKELQQKINKSNKLKIANTIDISDNNEVQLKDIIKTNDSLAHNKNSIINESPKVKLNIPKYLYHATYKPFYKSIINKGLGNTNRKMWGDSKGKGVVYLSTEPEVAYSYAETAEWLDNVDDYDKYADNIIVLVIDTDKLDKTKLFVDENVLFDNDVDPTYEYHGIIDSSAIVKIVDEQGKSINESSHLDSEVNMLEELNKSIKKIKPTLVICKTDSLGHSVWPKDAQEDDDDFWTNLYVSQYGEPLI